jgi:hypothetical protein
MSDPIDPKATDKTARARKSSPAMAPKQAGSSRASNPLIPVPAVDAVGPDITLGMQPTAPPAPADPSGSRRVPPAARPARSGKSSLPIQLAETVRSIQPEPPVPVLEPAHRSSRTNPSGDHRPLRIAHLYPSLLNVAGDGGNLIAIQRRAQWRGIPVEVVAVEKGESPDFRKFDIVLFHGGQDVEMGVAAADFAHKALSLREAAADGLVVFAVCAGLQLLGHRYVSNAGEEMVGAGILDLETRGGPQRFMQHAACEVTIDGVTETVVGFENHSGLTMLGPGCEEFGRVVAGAGNNGRDGLEGARWRNVFATYLHGPCLPKNPWLTDQLIRIAVGRAERVAPSAVRLQPLNDQLERRAHDVALAKAMANRGRRTALEPAKLVRGQ